MRFALGLGVALAACTAGDVDTDDPFNDPPDITGRYQVTVAGLTGCDQPEVLLAWFQGPLSVDGEPGALVFDFGEYSLDGSVDADFGFEMAGDLDLDGQDVSMFASGIAFSEIDDGGSNWTLDGEIDAIVAGGTSEECTIEGPFEALQVAQ